MTEGSWDKQPERRRVGCHSNQWAISLHLPWLRDFWEVPPRPLFLLLCVGVGVGGEGIFRLYNMEPDSLLLEVNHSSWKCYSIVIPSPLPPKQPRVIGFAGDLEKRLWSRPSPHSVVTFREHFLNFWQPSVIEIFFPKSNQFPKCPRLQQPAAHPAPGLPGDHWDFPLFQRQERQPCVQVEPAESLWSWSGSAAVTFKEIQERVTPQIYISSFKMLSGSEPEMVNQRPAIVGAAGRRR